MKRPTPAPKPAGIEPEGSQRAVFLVQANPYRGDFSLIFASDPKCNVRAEVTLTPDQAERIARTILADLDGWAERCAKVGAAMAGGAT